MFSRFFKKFAKIENDRPAFVQQAKDNKTRDCILGFKYFSPSVMNILGKEGFMTNEYIEGFAVRKAELEKEKVELERVNLDVLVNAELERVKAEIRERVVAEHNEKIADKDVEIRAIDRLIAREIEKLEAETAVETQENVEA